MMKEEEIAWIVREFANGRMQTDIGRELGHHAPGICQHIKRFCDKWSGYDVSVQRAYGDDRRRFAHMALRRYTEKHNWITKPPIRPKFIAHDKSYTNALNEHVWLLRVEGVSFREIGRRLKLSETRVRQRMLDFSKRVNRAMRRTHFKIYSGDAPIRDWLMVNTPDKAIKHVR
jgi:hypothetical protein